MGCGHQAPPTHPIFFFFFFFFGNHLFFCDQFEELHVMFIEVKLLINNAFLRNVYLNTPSFVVWQAVIMLF